MSAAAELIAITSGDLTARINPLGAELWSLTDCGGREFMTDGDPAFWTGHAPLLFPIVGALNGDRYRFDGREYHLPKHGFARRARFEVIEKGPSRVSLGLCDSDETRAVYPFAFALEMAFLLEGAVLHMDATIRNPGKEPLPFSFGYHPAFAWPLPGGAEKVDHVIAFDEPEPQPIRRVDPQSGLLLSDISPTPVDGHCLALDSSLFRDDAVIWDHLASRRLTFGAPGGAQLSIAFPDTPMLAIWQKPDAPFLCIEPWQGHADPVGFAGDLPNKPGILQLASGANRSFRMSVAVLSAD